MQYFNALPKVIVTDNNRVSRIMTNLMARTSIIPSVLKNPLLFYTYDIQEGDTPEIIAHKYYNDSYRYWIILYTNQLLDPQWDWPLTGNQLQKYIEDKYGYNSETDTWVTNPYTTAYEYQKIITKYESMSKTTTTDVIVIDENTYDNVIESTNYYTFSEGTVTISVTKNLVTLYQHEQDLNESKRNIKILNSIYVDQLETQFKKLMNV